MSPSSKLLCSSGRAGSARLAAASLALIFGLTLPAFAEAGYVSGPRSAGMGDTHRGIATGNDAIFLNPAGMSLFPRYVVEGFWRRHTGRNETLSSVSVVDSQTGPVAGGVAYTYDYAGSGGELRSGSRFDVASSVPLGEWLLFGATVSYLFMNTADGPVRRVTGDAGLLLRIGQSLNLGAVAHNLYNPTEDGDVARRTVGLGAGAVPFRNLVVGFDYRFEPDTAESLPVYSAGAELFFLGQYAARVGWTLDRPRDDHRLALGGSFVDESYGLDVSFARSIAGAPGYDVSVGLRFFVN